MDKFIDEELSLNKFLNEKKLEINDKKVQKEKFHLYKVYRDNKIKQIQELRKMNNLSSF